MFNELIKKYIDLKTGNAYDNDYDEKETKQVMKINEIKNEKQKKKCC